jgi:ribonuclease T2
MTRLKSKATFSHNMKVYVVLLLSVAVLVSASLNVRITAEVNKVKNLPNFDWFYLALSWPGSVCQSLSPCHIPASQTNNFTLHGLWPNNNDGTYPENCNSPAGKFDPKQINSILSDLNTYWTDFKQDQPNFWAHEWNKHGTCASSLPSLDTQLKYFTSSINLLKRLSITSALARNGIVPSTRKYNVADVNKALLKELGGAPWMQCSADGTIKEVRFCVNKQLQIFDCATKGSCHQVVFPPIKRA